MLEPSSIYAGRYVAADGTIRPHGRVEIVGGKISGVVEGESAGRGAEVRWPGAVLCPGLIDIRSQVGAFGNAHESTHAIDPGASAVDSVDWSDDEFDAIARCGITAVMIAPAPNNLVSGMAVVAKARSATGSAAPILLLRDGPLAMALGPGVWSYDRAPTSRIGSMAMLRSALEEAKAGGAHERLQALVAGKLSTHIVCGDAMDVSSALRTMREYGLRGFVVYQGDEHELAAEFRGYGVGAILGPLTASMTAHELAVPNRYAEAGIPIAFAGKTPRMHGDSLRISAALAVQHGLAPADARKALTVSPAIMAGVAAAVGSIHAGLDADLVVFSDDPLRLDARVLEVYINGVRVFSAQRERTTSIGATP